MQRGLGLTDLLTSKIRKQRSKTEVRQHKQTNKKVKKKKLTKPFLILGSEYMLIFVKVKKYTYNFFFFLLFKPVHQHALCRQLFTLKEW